MSRTTGWPWVGLSPPAGKTSCIHDSNQEGEPMRATIRVAVLSAALLAALAFAGSALASFTPKLTVKGAATGTSVTVNVGNNDAPTAKVSIYVPAGYTLSPPTIGSKLGDVTATASAADLGGAV